MRGPVSHTSPTTVTPTALALLELLPEPTVIDQAALAARSGTAPRTVRKALAELERVGAIARERRFNARGHRSADLIRPTGIRLSFGLRPKGGAPVWTGEVVELRQAMGRAGVVVGWSRLRPDVVEFLTERVRTVGVAALVDEARRRIWNPVRHVAAFLRFWRAMTATRPRRVVCPFHPGESIDRGRRCPGCASARANRVPMPDFLRAGRWRSAAIQST